MGVNIERHRILNDITLNVLLLASIITAAVILCPVNSVIFSNGIVSINPQCNNYNMSLSYL